MISEAMKKPPLTRFWECPILAASRPECDAARGPGGSDRLPSIHVGGSAPGDDAAGSVPADHEAFSRRHGSLCGTVRVHPFGSGLPLRPGIGPAVNHPIAPGK